MTDFHHPNPGWLALEEAALNLGVERSVLERLVANGSVRHERRVVLGQVITHLPVGEVFRLEALLGRARPGAPVTPPAPRPARPEVEGRERAFEEREALHRSRSRALEGQLAAARAECASLAQQLAAARAEAERLEGERLKLTATVAGLEQIRDQLGRLAQRTSTDERLRAARAALAAQRERLERAEARLRQQERLERTLREVQGELAAARVLAEAQAREIAMLRRVEHNNERYIERLERRLASRRRPETGDGTPG